MENNQEQTSGPQGWIVHLPKQKKEIKLDKKDRLILQSLIQNARTTLSTLSKITLLSKNSVINRINNYEKIGLTKGSSTFIDMQKLGLERYQIGIKTKMTLTQKDRFTEHLKKIKFLNQIMVLVSSHWDFSIRFYAKDQKHFDKIITQINAFQNIVHIDILPIKDWDFIPTKFIAPELDLNKYIKKEDSSFQKTFNIKKQTNEKISFDKKDLEILDVLSHNARTSLVDISSKVRLSPDTIKYRIKNLIQKGVIGNFFININPFLLGFNAHLFSFQIFNREKIDEIIKYLSNHPNCTGVLITKSNWNLFGAILIRDTHELKEFEEKFFAKFENYIHNYEFIQILEQPHYKMFMKEIINLK